MPDLDVDLRSVVRRDIGGSAVKEVKELKEVKKVKEVIQVKEEEPP